MGFSRRRFLKTTAAAGTVAVFAKDGLALEMLLPAGGPERPVQDQSAWPPPAWNQTNAPLQTPPLVRNNRQTGNDTGPHAQ